MVLIRTASTEAVLMSTNDLCFEQKYEEYQNFLSENFHFLVVKISVYLNKHVFVMFLFDFLGSSSDSSRKQIFRDRLRKYSFYFITKMYVVCSH